jgi:hypothetical protein
MMMILTNLTTGKANQIQRKNQNKASNIILNRTKMTRAIFSSRLIILFLIAFAFQAQGQEFLYLKKKYTAKTTKIALYDIIEVLEKNGEKTKGAVLRVTPKSVLLDGAEIDLDQVVYIRTNHMFWKGLGRSLEFGGMFFTGIFVANGLITGASPVITQGALIAVSSLIVVGVIMEVLSRKTYKMEKGWIIEPIIIPKE